MAQYESVCDGREAALRPFTTFGDHPRFDAAQLPGVSRLLHHEVREQQLMGHLLRLKELQVELMFLTERSAQCLLTQSRAHIAAQKHKEAAARNLALRHRLQEILSAQTAASPAEDARSTLGLQSSSYVSYTDVVAVCSLTGICSASVKDVHSLLRRLMLRIVGGNSACSTISSLMETLSSWLQSNYVAIFLPCYVPMTFILAASQLQRSADDKMSESALYVAQQVQHQREQRKREQQARQAQLLRAKERLERAEQHAFSVRKRIFLLYEWVTGKRRLPTGQLLNSVICAEVIHRIRADLVVGEMDFLLQLAANNGSALLNTTAHNSFLP
ncbi:copper-transporting ATPase-like protein [Trypanosoma rangeli]|uniref:Copper-transporting ATPase-like protein n=1 Tax=Trypanosoma rangeli TaxID=5698 RepID=A0A422NMP8_TRYRA|nr:copper-transporting ATPase-like protein [Trypanosoma rangeli]RNF06780.1 copper-transporting ATPase-like protein [Trypanosoma rangeli]|eukprot:RNF06780.1 copper-transporting ATPase-like protein [Trypanosoma rangeli]